jgi:tRNA-dihydrouridine synthase A
LSYDIVYRIKRDFSDLEVVINGGITSLDEAAGHLTHVDGVMIGREAYSHPYFLSEVDHRFFGEARPIPSRHEILQAYLPYISDQLERGTRLHHIARHLIGLFAGVPGAKTWRRYISENAHKKDAGVEVLEAAGELMSSPETRCIYSLASS